MKPYIRVQFVEIPNVKVILHRVLPVDVYPKCVSLTSIFSVPRGFSSEIPSRSHLQLAFGLLYFGGEPTIFAQSPSDTLKTRKAIQAHTLTASLMSRKFMLKVSSLMFTFSFPNA